MTDRPDDRPADRIADTLTALRADTDHLPLADSGSVRRRGEQRTRNQVVGSTLVVAALVAGALGVAGSLTGSDQSIQGPPGNGQGSVTADVTEKSAEPAVARLAEQPLLEAADIPTFAGATGWQVNPDEEAADQPGLRCLEQLSLRGDETAKRQFYTELAPQATEHVLRFASAALAQNAMAELRDALAACGEQAKAGDASADVRPVEDTSAGFRYSQSSAPAGSEVSYVEVDAARRVNVVVVLQWNGFVDEVGSDQGTWVWDDAALDRALDRAIG